MTTINSHTLQLGFHSRHYLIVQPESVPPRDWPAVIMLHGAGGTAEWTLEETGWQASAEKAGFLLVLPDATRADSTKPAGFLHNPQVWNSGGSQNLLGAPPADDVCFLDALVEEVLSNFPVDPSRVFLTGFSNGASMVFRAGAELAVRFAALAPVAGYLTLAKPRIDPPRPTFYLIGSADPIVPLAGGPVRSPWDGTTRVRTPVGESLRTWAAALGCEPDSVPIDGPRAVRAVRYPAISGHADLVTWVIEGLGHHWPGGRGLLSRRIAGPPTDVVRANDVIWQFFQRHRA